MTISTKMAGAFVALSMISGTAVLAETQTANDPMAEAQAFLASPTSLAQATATAEAASGGKVSAIAYQTGENGAPDLIMADIVMADGSQKTVSLNPADGKVMNVAVATDEVDSAANGDQNAESGEDSGADGENGAEDGEGSNG
jgi:hypothetical protein